MVLVTASRLRSVRTDVGRERSNPLPQVVAVFRVEQSLSVCAPVVLDQFPGFWRALLELPGGSEDRSSSPSLTTNSDRSWSSDA